MRHVLKTAGLAALLALSAAAGVNSASAQGFGIQFGERGYDRPVERRIYREAPVERRIYRDEDRGYRRGVVEERIIRRPAPTRTVCRTEVRERIRRDGAYVRKPVQVCRQVVGGYRGY